MLRALLVLPVAGGIAGVLHGCGCSDTPLECDNKKPKDTDDFVGYKCDKDKVTKTTGKGKPKDETIDDELKCDKGNDKWKALCKAIEQTADSKNKKNDAAPRPADGLACNKDGEEFTCSADLQLYKKMWVKVADSKVDVCNMDGMTTWCHTAAAPAAPAAKDAVSGATNDSKKNKNDAATTAPNEDFACINHGGEFTCSADTQLYKKMWAKVADTKVDLCTVEGMATYCYTAATPAAPEAKDAVSGAAFV